MTTLTRNDCAAFLKERNGFAIITHSGPDGDTVGSAAALCLGLRKLGKTAHVVENAQLPKKFQHLLENLAKPAAENGDILISVDTASAKMVSEDVGELANAIDLRIDHHGSGTPFAAFELVDSTAAACSEIIFDLLGLLGVEMDVSIANALYTAVSTDTGCFRYANTTSRSFALASACAAVSPDIFKINQTLFDTVTLGRLRLEGWVTAHMELLREGQIAICAIPAELQEELGLADEDMKNIAGFLRSIEGVKMAATVRQDTEGHTGLSVRAVPGWDAAAICAKFGGGGHKGAAGASLQNVTLTEAMEALKEAIQK